MNILIVDDEPLALQNLNNTILEIINDCVINCFDNKDDALQFAANNQVDIAFLDIEMAEMNGLMLAQKLKEIYSKTNIIFVSGYSKYAIEAFSVQASDYLLKPADHESVKFAIENLRNPVREQNANQFVIQTFGNFEIFVNNKQLTFSRTKTKELFAYLVSRRGAYCSNNEIIAVIWENKLDSLSLQSQFRHLVADLIKTLKNVGYSDVIIKRRGYLAVVPSKVCCDYYDFVRGDTRAVNNYTGEFMMQYSWAEFVQPTRKYNENISHF